MFTKILFITLAPLALCSCLTAEQLAARRQAELAALQQQDHALCAPYPARYAECRAFLQQVRTDKANIEAAQQAAFSGALLNAGATMIANQPAPPPPQQIQFPVRCRSAPIGNAVQTTCQ